jgi:hypothetical protein
MGMGRDQSAILHQRRGMQAASLVGNRAWSRRHLGRWHAGCGPGTHAKGAIWRWPHGCVGHPSPAKVSGGAAKALASGVGSLPWGASLVQCVDGEKIAEWSRVAHDRSATGLAGPCHYKHQHCCLFRTPGFSLMAEALVPQRRSPHLT